MLSPRKIGRGKEDKTLVKNKFRLMIIGQREGVPFSARRELERVEKLTKHNQRMTIVLALNYGGRTEIVDSVKKILREKNVDIDSLDEKKFSHYLYTGHLPDPDLLIRTSGEMRVSNFLLYQIAYSEIWITQEYWPDFSKIKISSLKLKIFTKSTPNITYEIKNLFTS